MADRRTIRRFRANLQAETDSAFLYRALARRESKAEVSALYLRMAREEEEHAELWRRKLSEAGIEAPAPRPGWRPRLLAWAARRFGPESILATVVAMESKDRSAYGRQPEVRSTAVPAQEGAHGRLLQAMLEGGDRKSVV
jgi:rubrerythrin